MKINSIASLFFHFLLFYPLQLIGDMTTLHRAVLSGKEEAVRIHLTPVNVNKTTKRGHTPLYLAVFSGYEQIVLLLLENGADSTILPRNVLSLVDVAEKRGYNAIQEILEVMAEASSRNISKSTHSYDPPQR